MAVATMRPVGGRHELGSQHAACSGEETMMAPVTFITTYAIKAVELEEFRQFVRGLLEVLGDKDRRTLAINAFLNADRTEAAIVQIMPDSDSIKDYWRIVHQHTGRTLSQLVENPTSVQIYGAPGGLMLERTRHSTESGVAVSVKPEHLGGFVRLGSVAS
jgi:hypothetical protein